MPVPVPSGRATCVGGQTDETFRDEALGAEYP